MYIYIYSLYIYMYTTMGVATICSLLKNIGLFCKRSLQKRQTYILQKRPIFLGSHPKKNHRKNSIF